MSKDIFMRIIEGADSYHMKEDFLFSLFFVRERHNARDGLRADQRNFNLKIHKLSISKINSISRTAEEL